jgi:hypothetical protein
VPWSHQTKCRCNLVKVEDSKNTFVFLACTHFPNYLFTSPGYFVTSCSKKSTPNAIDLNEDLHHNAKNGDIVYDYFCEHHLHKGASADHGDVLPKPRYQLGSYLIPLRMKMNSFEACEWQRGTKILHRKFDSGIRKGSEDIHKVKSSSMNVSNLDFCTICKASDIFEIFQDGC